jgi:hypothetical protein
MRTVLASLLLFLLLPAPATPASAAQFTCDVVNGICHCDPPKTSEDCKGMARNCDGDMTCGGTLPRCRCKYEAPAAMIEPGSQPTGGKPPLHAAPTAGVKQLEAAPGAKPQAPANTGVPVAPPSSSRN